MSKSKIVGIVALLAFVMGIVLVNCAGAAEYVKCRFVTYNTKWEQINVGDDKDHVVSVTEFKGINSNMEGKTFAEGLLVYAVGLYDVNPKIGVTGNGYMTMTDKDGHKTYSTWDQKGLSGTWAYYKGTGKFEGIKGKGTWSLVPSADPKLNYCDWEGQVELPR